MNGYRTLMSGLLLAVAIVAGCSSQDQKAGEEGCVADNECPGAEVCRAGFCALEETKTRSIGFYLSPPALTVYPPQRVAPAALEPGAAVQIGLEPGARVAGRVEYAEATALGPSGQLKFKREGPKARFVTQVRVEDGAYEAYVPPGSYSVTLLPDDPQTPTKTWRDVMVELDTDPKLSMARQFVEVQGTLSRIDATTRDAVRVRSARVFAVSTETGSVSTTGTSDQDGNFSFFVQPASGVYDLKVSPSEDNTLVPEATFGGAFEVVDRRWVNRMDGNDEAGNLAVGLGEYSSATVNATFALTAAQGGEIDWTGTTVTLSTQLEVGPLFIRLRPDTDGIVQADVVPGVYRMLVRPPSTSQAANLSMDEIAIDADNREIPIEVPTRRRISGVVIGPDEAPVVAQVTFSSTEPGAAEDASVTTEDDGTFGVWLEALSYEASVVPANPELPRLNDVISAATDDSELAFDIPPGVVIWGSVLGTPVATANGEWSPVPDVTLQAFEVRDGREVVIGVGQTDQDGDFAFVLPPSP